MTRAGWATLVMAAACVAGCGAKKQDVAPLDALDDRLTQENVAVADPAIADALRDQIMVDPQLVSRANANALRPPPAPATDRVPKTDVAAAAMPAERDAVRPAPPAHATCRQCEQARRALTLGALAQAQGGAIGGCAARVGYSYGWAAKLPAAVPLYPDARVTEAAGADGHGCALRVVSFASSASPRRLLDWYYTKTSAAGFRAEHGADLGGDMLAGTGPGGAFLLVVHARPGGSEADLMADAG